MGNQDLTRLFRPGDGGLPPYLAGRSLAHTGQTEVTLDNLDQLYQLGYVWRVERFDYEPGIPSLMNYVQKYAQT